jgi:hypothetical protein
MSTWPVLESLQPGRQDDFAQFQANRRARATVARATDESVQPRRQLRAQNANALVIDADRGGLVESPVAEPNWYANAPDDFARFQAGRHAAEAGSDGDQGPGEGGRSLLSPPTPTPRTSLAIARHGLDHGPGPALDFTHNASDDGTSWTDALLRKMGREANGAGFEPAAAPRAVSSRESFDSALMPEPDYYGQAEPQDDLAKFRAGQRELQRNEPTEDLKARLGFHWGQHVPLDPHTGRPTTSTGPLSRLAEGAANFRPQFIGNGVDLAAHQPVPMAHESEGGGSFIAGGGSSKDGPQWHPDSYYRSAQDEARAAEDLRTAQNPNWREDAAERRAVNTAEAQARARTATSGPEMQRRNVMSEVRKAKAQIDAALGARSITPEIAAQKHQQIEAKAAQYLFQLENEMADEADRKRTADIYAPQY